MRGFNEQQIYGGLSGASLLCCSSSCSTDLDPAGELIALCQIPLLHLRVHFSAVKKKQQGNERWGDRAGKREAKG